MSNIEETDSFKDIFEQFESIMEHMVVFKSQIGLIQTQFKSLEKNVKKQLNSLKKVASKNKNKGNRKPTGFAKPTKEILKLFILLSMSLIFFYHWIDQIIMLRLED